MRKHLFILPLAVVAWSALLGQAGAGTRPLSRHEFTFYAGGGLSTLHYESSIGSSTGLSGGLFGASYRVYFAKKVGFGMGVELSYYNAKGAIGEYLYAEPAKDPEGADFEFRTMLRDYGENQNIAMFNIPLMLHFRGDPEKHRPYAAIGVKMSIPVSGKYRIVEGASFNSGYYVFEDYEYTTQKFLGFGSFSGNGDRELSLKPAYLLAIEAGMNWRLKYVLLYTGFYVDYGLSDVVEKRDELIASYNRDNPANRSTGSMIDSQYKLDNGQSEYITSKVIPLAAGFKIGITLGHGRKREIFIDYDQSPMFIQYQQQRDR
ncbi:MAG: hypothetical protein LBT49_04735 [Prevotellaceae bacterium]|jgi:hypothetical protein|nr:hypothetical protein [Prevotellaceae bacterium]